MSKYLRGDIRDYWCWHVRGASRHAASLCPLQSLSLCTAQWPWRCHSEPAHVWPTYTLCPQTGRRLAASATEVRRSAETAQRCTRSSPYPHEVEIIKKTTSCKPRKTVYVFYYHPKLGSFYKHWYNRVKFTRFSVFLFLLHRHLLRFTNEIKRNRKYTG